MTNKMSIITMTLFTNRRIRFVSYFFLTAFVFVFFAWLIHIPEFGAVTISVFVPVFFYYILFSARRFSKTFKKEVQKERIHLEYTELARKENQKIKKVVIKDTPKMDAFSVLNTKIVMSSTLFTGKFSELERRALLYHEIGHTKKIKNDFLTQIMLIPVLFVGILCMIIFSESISFFSLLLMVSFFVSLYLLIVEMTRWRSEYNADNESCQKVSP